MLEIKNTMSEINNLLDRFKRKILGNLSTAKWKVSKLKTKREKNGRKSCEICRITSNHLIYVQLESQKKRRSDRVWNKEILVEIMARKYLVLMKDIIDPKIQ